MTRQKRTRHKKRQLVVALRQDGSGYEVYPSVTAAAEECRKFATGGGPKPKGKETLITSARCSIQKALDGQAEVIYGRYWVWHPGGEIDKLPDLVSKVQYLNFLKRVNWWKIEVVTLQEVVQILSTKKQGGKQCPLKSAPASD